MTGVPVTNLLRGMRSEGRRHQSCGVCLCFIGLVDQQIADLDRLIAKSEANGGSDEHACLLALRADLQRLRSCRIEAGYSARPPSNRTARPAAHPRQHLPAPMKAEPITALPGPSA